MDFSTITLWQAVIVFLAGIGAGFVNALAGGGSLLAIASLLFIGLPSPIANATNRVAIVLQNAVSVRRYRRAGMLDFRDSLHAVLPAGIGAIVGAFLAVEVSEAVFDIALAVVLVLVVITVFIPTDAITRSPRGKSREGAPGSASEASARSRNTLVLTTLTRWGTFFLVGVYGGFVQSGVGFLLIAAITFTRGYDLVKTNAVKVSVVIVFGAIGLTIFAINDMVIWSAGLLLGAGTMVGAWIGVHAAIKHGTGFIRFVIVASAGAAALRLLGVF